MGHNDSLQKTLDRLTASRASADPSDKLSVADPHFVSADRKRIQDRAKPVSSVETRLKQNLQAAHAEAQAKPPTPFVPQTGNVTSNEQVCELLGMKHGPWYEKISAVQRLTYARQAEKVFAERAAADKAAKP